MEQGWQAACDILGPGSYSSGSYYSNFKQAVGVIKERLSTLLLPSLQTVRLYDQTGILQGRIGLEAPVLDGCFQDDTTAFAGQLDGIVSRCVGQLERWQPDLLLSLCLQ